MSTEETEITETQTSAETDPVPAVDTDDLSDDTEGQVVDTTDTN